MYFAGLRGTGSFGVDERPKNFREMILWMNPAGTAPLFALTSKGKTEVVDDPEFNWWEEANTIARFAVDTIVDAVITTITLSPGQDGRQLIPGDVLQVEPAVQTVLYAPELMRVVQVLGPTSISVERGVAGTTAAAAVAGQFVTRVGNAQSEGNLSVASSSTNPVKFNNFCQIFKTPYTITKTALATKFRTGDPKKNEQKRKSFQHSEKIEQALFWGIPFETVDPSNGNMPLRYTGGLRNFIATNATVFTADPTLVGFMNAVSPVFDYEAGGAGNERIVFAGNGALNYLNQLVATSPNTNITYDGIVKFYGMDLRKYVLPQGTLYLKSHPLMNVHPQYKNSMFVVNPSGIIYRPLKGRDTHLEKDIQPNDADFIKDQWLTEAGFEFHHEKTFAYLGEFKDFP